MRTLLLLFAFAVTCLGQDADATARLLAGLPLEGTNLASFSQVPAWRDHAKQMDTAWSQHETRQTARLRAWAPVNIPEIHSSQSPVFYFFSGPDILYAQALFPNAGTYVLCAKEPVGMLGDPSEVPASEMPVSLAWMRKSLTSLLGFSFFITKDLRVDIQQRHFTGVLPVIQILLVRSGARIVDVDPVSCDRSGGIHVGTQEKGTPGARIRFQRSGGVQTVFYFAGDVSDGGLASHSGVLRFCERLGRGQSLLKAASYLPHEAGFSRIRDWLLANSRTIVQDASGIPYRYFDAANWRVSFWGNEARPIELFAKYPQPDLEEAVAAAPRPDLPFGFGYQYHPRKTLLMVAQRSRGPIAAEPGGLRR